MDAKQLEAMRAAAATRAGSVNRTSVSQATALGRAATTRRSLKTARPVAQVMRAGGRSGGNRPMPLDANE
jgi:hypothetical protein